MVSGECVSLAVAGGVLLATAWLVLSRWLAWCQAFWDSPKPKHRVRRFSGSWSDAQKKAATAAATYSAFRAGQIAAPIDPGVEL